MKASWKRGWVAAAVTLLMTAAIDCLADPAEVKVADAPPAISVVGRSALKTSVFRKSRITVPLNERIGDLQDGVFCSGKGNAAMTAKLASMVGAQIPRTYNAEMTNAGYPRQGASESLFEEKPATPASADFDVGATIRGMQMNICIKSGEILGGVWFQVKWEIYSPTARKVMYETVSEGSYQNTSPEKLRFEEFMGRALAKATRNMLSDQRFVDLMTGSVEIPVAAPLPPQTYALKRGKAPGGGAAQNATALRGAVVTIEAGGRTGSGFFVSREGHVLTNAHVVRDARIVKVRLATGRELVGEVLKTDTQRDVALIKTEITGVEPLAVRESEPNVGEDVFALGSPLGQAFSGTLTRGILSGHRTFRDLRFLQSDVAILPGSSGGPLLDSSGTVIGLTVAGLDSGRANLNLFIPIREALDRLTIELKD